MTSRSAWWFLKALKAKKRAGGSREGGLKAGSALRRWVRPLFVEELEPRLAPTAKILYTAPATGSDLTLRVAQLGGVANLQLYDNAQKAVLQGVALNQDARVQITGAAAASDLLTIDFSYTAGGTAEPITVLFDGGAPAQNITDKVTIAGSGPLYVPSTFSLQSDDDIFVPGALQAVGDISLTASQQSTGAVTGPGTITASASANITVNGGSLTGHTITLAAQSTINVNSQSAALFNGLVQVGAVNSNSGAAVQVQSGSLTASGDLNLSATSNVTAALATAPAAPGAPKDDAAVSNSTIAGTASVVVSGGMLLAPGGKANIAAANTVNVTTTADGTAGGAAPSASGGTVAVTVLSGDTSATVSGGTVSASAVNLTSTSNRTVTTAATATQGGAAPGSPNNTQGQQTLANNNATTPDGSVNVAAAVAVTSVTGDSKARISGGNVTSTSSPLTVTASAANKPTTTADASPVTGAPGTGVGAAVGIGLTTANSVASLGGTANLTAPAVNVNGLTPSSTFTVGATSGSGGAAVGVAGSLAIDVTTVRANAQVEPGSNVNVHGADLTLSAQSTTASPAAALPRTVAGQSVGVGASVALNVPAASARAAVENGATLSGAHALTVSALGNHTATTGALAGAAGGTATAGAVSLAIPSGATEAVVGTGPALTLTGGLTVTTDRTTATTTRVDGASAVSGAAVGASVGLTVASESAEAAVGRGVQTGAAPALLHAEGHGTSSTTALASVSGAKPGTTAVNTLLGNLAAFAKGQGWAPGTVTLPDAATPDGQAGVAGAVAVNVAALDASAQLLPGASLQVAGGALTVEATTTYSDSAVADGTAVNTKAGVAGVVAINVSRPTAEAIIAGSATAAAVQITATVSGQTDVTADSGEGSTDVGVAGALALNIPAAASHAAVAAGGSVTLTGPPATSDVTVQATTTVSHDNATADGKALGFAKTGVGASVALDIPGNGAAAEVSGSVTSPHQVTVSADGDYTATATAAAGATGGTITAPALSLAVPHNTTLALIGAAAVVSAGAMMLVRASHRGTSTSRARGDTAGSDVAVGAALAVGVGLDDDEAEVAGTAHSPALTVETDLGETSSAVGIASAKGATSGGAGINNVIGGVVTFGQSSGWLPAQVSVPVAKTPDGSMAVAAAAAVNVDLTGATATVTGSGSVVTNTPLLVHTVTHVDASAGADGGTADGSSLGVGAALAVNVARPAIEASIAGTVKAPAVNVKTEMGGDGTNTFQATASSGAGVTATGVAGALAINVGAGQSEAAIRDGARLTIGGGKLLVNATNATANFSNALALSANVDVGDGASFAANVALNESHADIGAAAITGESDVTVEADGTHQVTTLSNAGALVPDTAAAAAMSAAFAGDQTVAEVLAAPTTLMVPGLLDIHAGGSTTLTTTADGRSDSDRAGEGAAVAVGIDREVVTARLARNSQVNAIRLLAVAQSPTTTSASASAQGGKDLGQGIGEFVNTLVGLVDPKSGTPQAVKLPVVGDTLTAIQDKLGVPLPSLSLAAAVGVSAVLPQTLAEVAANAALTSTTAVTVQTDVTANPLATADGSATGSTIAADLALAANYAGGNNQVAVGNNAAITAPAITLSAGGLAPQTLTAKASAGGGLIGSAAASVALNAGAPFDPNAVQVTVGTGSHLTATKGNVALRATSDVTTTTLAGGTALGLLAGVGASVAGAYLQEQANVAVAGQVDAPQGQVSLTATGHDTLQGAATAGAVGLGVADAAVRADVLSKTVQAHIDPGAKVHAFKDVVINAVSKDDPQALEVSLGLSAATAAAAATGVAFDEHTRAFIDGATVRADGNVLLTAESTSPYSPLACVGSLGLVGDVSLAGTLFFKAADTRAYITGGARVDARALGASAAVLTGTKTNGVPDTRSIRGVSLTAANFDDFEPLTGAVGGGGIAAAAGSGIATILNNHVAAYIDAGSRVNQNAKGSGPGQLVNLLAWDDTHTRGLQGDVGAALVAGVSATFDFALLVKDTEAYVGANAVVGSNSNVEVRANSTEDLGSFTGTFNLGGLASAAAAGALHVIQDQTLARTDGGAQVNAPGSVLVLANSSGNDNVIAVVGSSAAISGQAMYSQTDVGGATFAPINLGQQTIGGAPGLTSAAVGSGVKAATLNVAATSTSTPSAETVLVGAGALTAGAARPIARTSLQTAASLGPTANVQVGTLVGPHASSVNTASAFDLQISAGAITGTALAPDAEAGGPAYDLQLAPALNDVKDIPGKGTDRIVVASVQNVLHFRVFDGDGRTVVDTDEGKLPAQAGPIADLKQQLQNLWSLPQLTEEETDRVINAVATILGNIRGATRAFVAEGARVKVTASDLNVRADATNHAGVTPVQITAGSLSGSYGIPRASTAEDVEAYVGPAQGQAPNMALNGKIDVGKGTVAVNAESPDNQATVNEISIKAGGLSLDYMHPQATTAGTTRAHVGGDFAITAGAVNVTGSAGNTATANEVSLDVTALTGSANGQGAKTSHTTEAYAGPKAGLTLSGGALALHATSTNKATSGQVALSVAPAAVKYAASEADVAGATRAYVPEGTTISATGLDLSATSDNTAEANPINVGVAAVSVDVAHPIAETAHVTEVYVGPPGSDGPTPSTPGTISVGGGAVTGEAASTNRATVDALDIGAKAVGVSVLHPEVTAGGSTQAHLGGQFGITAGQVSFTANSKSTATANAVSVELSGVSVTDDIKSAETDHDTRAFVGRQANLTITGASAPLRLDAESNGTARAGQTQVSIDGVNVSLVQPAANADGTTRAYVDEGAQLEALGLVATATATNTATAGVTMVLVGGVNVAVIQPTARTGDDAQAYIGPEAGAAATANLTGNISVPRTVDLSATSHDTAQVNGMTVTVGAVNVKSVRPEVTAGGDTLAHVGGQFGISAGSVRVTASAPDTRATTQFTALDIGAVNVSVAETPVTAGHETEAFLAPGANLTITGGPLTFHATSGNSATAKSQNVNIGAVNVDVLSADANVAGATRAYVGNGAVLKAGTVSLMADSDKNSAAATLDSFGLSLVDVVKLDPSATAQHGVEAYLDGGSDVTATGTLTISATSANSADASSDGKAGSAVSVADVNPHAIAQGDTKAHIDGKAQTGNLSVTATATRNARAGASVLSISVVAGHGGASSAADVHGDTLAELSGSARLTTTGNAVFQATSTPTASASAGGGGGAILFSNAALSSHSTIDDRTRAFADDGATGIQADNLEFHALNTATASSDAAAGSGGAFSDGESDAEADVGPVVQAYLGNNVQVKHAAGNVVLDAESVRAQGDATAQVDSGGAGTHGASRGIVNSHPTVAAFIGTGTTVNADGNVTITAGSHADPGGGPVLGDTFDPSTAVNVAKDTITFQSHGLTTGDVVTYDPNGSTPVGTPSGSLRGGEFGSIVVDPNTLMLGATFSGSAASTGDLFNPQDGVDPDRAVIRFATKHHFDTGDAVKYDANGHTFISKDINEKSTFYVRKIDDYTIKLFNNLADAKAADVQLDPGASGVVSGNTITRLGNGFINGDAVTYHAPAPAAFSSEGVNIDVDNNGRISNPNDTSANDIYLGSNDGNNNITKHKFVTGERVTYRAEPGKTAVGGLTDGGTYWVIKSGDYTAQLAASYADAFAGKAITLKPDKSAAGEAVRHFLVPAPIGGLSDGLTYYVRNANTLAGTFQLSATPGGSILALDVGSPADRTGPHSFHKAGLLFNGASGGTQDLHIDLTTNPAGSDKLLGPGGVSLRLISPPPGNGVSAASAGGGEGGVVASADPYAETDATPTVQAFVAAHQLNAGGDVVITTFSTASTSAHGDNAGGGVIFGGSVTAETSYQTNNAAFVGTDNGSGIDGGGVQITAGGHFRLAAVSSLQQTNVSTNSDGGGFLANADAHSDAEVGGTTRAVVGTDAAVQAQTVDVLADYASAQGNLDAGATAGGLFGGASAETRGGWSPTVVARLAGGGANTTLTGTSGVDVRALTQNVNVSQNPHASFFGIGSSNSDKHLTTTLSSRVEGDSQVTVTAGPRLLPGEGVPPADFTPLQRPAGYPLLALYVDASVDPNSKDGDRHIGWDSNVVLLSGPSPDLLIDPTGQVVKAINVSVNGGQRSGKVAGNVSVDPIVNNKRGQALFQSDNSGNSVVAASLPTGPLFTFRETYQTVSLVNQSANSLIINDINVIDTTPLLSVPAVQVALDANDVKGFQFSVNHDFKPTTITVHNASGAVGVAGTVNNPIGITRVTDDLGNIVSAGGLIRTDSFALQALKGSIGAPPLVSMSRVVSGGPLRLEVVGSNDGPRAPADRFRTADASGNVYLDIRGLYRGAAGSVPAEGFVTHIGRITAGQDVNLFLENGLVQTTVTPVPYQVRVYETPAVTSPDTPNPMTVADHFRPGTPGSTPTVFPTGVFGTAVVGVAVPVDYDFGIAADPSTGVIAGGNIVVAGPLGGSSPLVAVSGYAHLGGKGQLKVLTKGFLKLR
jgi:hypothetical protein